MSSCKNCQRQFLVSDAPCKTSSRFLPHLLELDWSMLSSPGSQRSWGQGSRWWPRLEVQARNFLFSCPKGLSLPRWDPGQRELGKIAARKTIFSRKKGNSDTNMLFLELRSPGLENFWVHLRKPCVLFEKELDQDPGEWAVVLLLHLPLCNPRLDKSLHPQGHSLPIYEKATCAVLPISHSSQNMIKWEKKTCAGAPCAHESWTKQTFQALWESLKENMLWKTDSSKSIAGSEGHSPGSHWSYRPGIGLASLLCSWVRAQSVQSCLTLCEPMDYSPPGSPVHGILQARLLEKAAIPFSRGSSQPRDRTYISFVIGRQVLYH